VNNQTATICRSADGLLDQLLEEITSRIQAGELVNLDEYAAAHPEYADRLQRLLPAMQLLVAFGQSESTSALLSSKHPASSIEAPTFNTGVLGDFRIIREIGRGGMGVVYEAEQISIGRPVALKVLPFASMLDERRLARFRNEIRAAGQLHHTNIVPIYAVGSDRGVHFYAMQLVAGQTLAQVVEQMRKKEDAGCSMLVTGLDPASSNQHPASRNQHPVSSIDTQPIAALSTQRSTGGAAYYRTVASLGIQAAEALEHAHSCGIVHRDIKPSNLLLDERGTLWLTDFGLAAVDSSGDLTMSGDLLGTLRYMSPEQTLGSRVVLDHRTDIYSLGATVYELLTLQPAFDAADRGELLRQIAVVEPRPPRRIDPAIPADLETIVLKAMSKDATSRYASAQSMADDLRRFLEHKPIQARRPSLLEKASKWARRHVALISISATAFALATLTGLVAALFAFQAYNSEARQRVVAESNLAIAAESIDRLLSRAAGEKYWHGDLKQAESFAADATEFYEKLLANSDKPELRLRAARAHGDVANIWRLVGRYEKAAIAHRRAAELLQRLTTTFPGESVYLVELARNYNHTGLIDWALDRPLAAEPSFRQAWEIFTELSERFPDNPTYQDGVADMLSNLGSVCYFSDRFDEAEEYYRRAEAIAKHLPAELKNSAEGLASEAGSITCRAHLALLRKDYERALKLLEASIPLHEASLAKWPNNPVALDCYFNTHWCIAAAHLGAGRHAEAAAAIERYVESFPQRLQAYHQGAEQLLLCAKLADEAGTDESSKARDYRQRANELVGRAHEAPQRTSDTANEFAWFLLTCEDKSFRDARRALDLANSVLVEVPERGDAWRTLALAHYRIGDWQAADSAAQTAAKLPDSAGHDGFHLVLLSMVRWQQGRRDDARQLHLQAIDWSAGNTSLQKEIELGQLLSEATNVIQSAPN
jgi:serine/threonine protein kinase